MLIANSSELHAFRAETALFIANGTCVDRRRLNSRMTQPALDDVQRHTLLACFENERKNVMARKAPSH